MRTPIRAYYTLHYSKPNGLDCSIHWEPNPHMDGLLHYQEREEATDAYTYEPVSFSAPSVTGLLWKYFIHSPIGLAIMSDRWRLVRPNSVHSICRVAGLHLLCTGASRI